MKTILSKIWKNVKYVWLKIKYSSFYQTYKEEMIAIPILLLIFYVFNNFFISLFPNDAFYDFPSQLETIMYKILLFMVTLFVSHIALRIAFPKIYTFLNKEVYHKFDELEKPTAIKYSIAFILVFIIAAALIFGGR